MYFSTFFQFLPKRSNACRNLRCSSLVQWPILTYIFEKLKFKFNYLSVNEVIHVYVAKHPLIELLTFGSILILSVTKLCLGYYQMSLHILTSLLTSFLHISQYFSAVFLRKFLKQLMKMLHTLFDINNSEWHSSQI